jgi:hypothetical protein
MKRTLVVAAALVALAACRSSSRSEAQPVKASRAQPLATFTMQVSAVGETPPVVVAPPYVATAARAANATGVRAASAQIPIVRDGQLTNPEGTFELYSSPSVFKKWPHTQSPDCANGIRDSIRADVFLKAFTKENLRSVSVRYTSLPAAHPSCATEIAPTGGDFGQRSYVTGDRLMWGNAANPTQGGPDEVVTWSFQYTIADASFPIVGEIWAEPVPALSVLGAPFASPPNNASPPSLGTGAIVLWSQSGAAGDPVVDSVTIKVCADATCSTGAAQQGTGTRSGSEFTYTLQPGLTNGASYWIFLFNQWDPGTGAPVTGSLSPTPAKFVYTGV